MMLALLSWGISTGNLFASMLAGAMLAAVIVFGGSLVLVPDNLGSEATERAMSIASSMLEHMRGGLTPESCNAVCQIILPETTALAVALTDTNVVLAYAGEQAAAYLPGSPNTGPVIEVLKSGRMETFSTRDARRILSEGFPSTQNIEAFKEEGYPVGMILPLVVADKPVGTLKLYYK
ncbi:MAG: sensor histidine kinase, partial [Atopobiaceae bacterium]|nr:sensor histidine kinase [Atopobiaceae bacterium]